MWSTSNFIRPMKANGITPKGFTAAWTERTALYLSDIETLPQKTWKKILTAALKIVEDKKGAVSSLPVCYDFKRFRQSSTVVGSKGRGQMSLEECKS